MAEGSQADFYVCSLGSDAWSGKHPAPNADRSNGPFATLKRARDAVRQLKKDRLEKPVTVMVRGGKYYLDQTWLLTDQDSGTSECPITYTAYPGEKPIISGGRKLTGWQSYKGNILQCELPETGHGKWKFRQLFHQGHRLTPARYPNHDPDNPLYGGWAYMVEGLSELDKDLAFKYRPATFSRRWSKPTQGHVNFFNGPNGHSYQQVHPIKDVDETNRVITLAHRVTKRYPIDQTLRPGNRFIVENILEELDKPGEWCLDSETGRVYFWPPGDSVGPAEVTAPVLAQLIHLQNVAWINLSGFTFTHTLSRPNLYTAGQIATQFSAAYLENIQHCTLEDNDFLAPGSNAVCVEGYCLRNSFQRNEIRHAGATGIRLFGNRENHPMFNHINDNHIHHCGVLDKYVGVGVVLDLCEGNWVSHNNIHHTSRAAIGSFSFDLPGKRTRIGTFMPPAPNIIEYNDIRHAAQEITDTAAISLTGNIIRNNLIADTGHPPFISVDAEGDLSIANPKGGQGDAIYRGEWSHSCLIEDNVIVRATLGIVLLFSRNNLIQNNLFVDCQLGQVHYCGGTKDEPGFFAGNHFCRNIFYATQPESFVFSTYIVDTWSPETDLLARSDYNLFYNAAGGDYLLRWQLGSEKLPLAKWKNMGFDTHSVIADPLFMDPAQDDYRLHPDSPAFQLGFRPPDVANIGPRPAKVPKAPPTLPVEHKTRRRVGLLRNSTGR